MNYTKCAECKQESHRREFRKKGGGFYTTCKTCRAARKKEIKNATDRLRYIRELDEFDRLEAYRVQKEKELIKEYKRITRLNRDRIKAMEKKENPTKLTITWLNRRLAIQDEWHKALNYLLTRVHQGQQVGTLSEYMETRD